MFVDSVREVEEGRGLLREALSGLQSCCFFSIDKFLMFFICICTTHNASNIEFFK